MRPRKYAAFYREKGARRWKRLHPDIAGSKDGITRMYQSWLIAGIPGEGNISRIIRPVKRKKI